MFFCNKWMTSDGSLKGPWIEGKFNGNIPEYIQFKANHDVQHVCDNLLEVMKSNSKNMKHRISLRLSAALSYGVCSLYKKKVGQLYEEWTRQMYPSLTDIDFQRKEFETYEPSLSDFMTDDHRISEEFQEERSLVSDSNKSTEKESLDMGPIRGVAPSPEYAEQSIGLASASENDITVINFPRYNTSPPTMLPCDAENTSHNESQILVEANNVETALDNLMDETHAIQIFTDQDNIMNVTVDNSLLRVFKNVDSQGDENNYIMTLVSDHEENNADERLKIVSDKDEIPCEGDKFIESNIKNTKESHGSKRKRSISSISNKEQEYQSTMCISERHSNLQSNKIQDTYENFVIQWHPEEIEEDSSVSQRKKKKLCFIDTRTSLSDSYIKRNIYNSQSYNNNRDNAEEMCGVESSGGMLHITQRKKDQEYGDVTPINIISPDASPKDAVQTSSVDNVSNVSLNPNTSESSRRWTSSSESIMHIDVPLSPNEEEDMNEGNQNIPTLSGKHVQEDVTSDEHSGVVNVILPMYLKHRVDPGDIKVVVGQMKECNDVHIQIHTDLDSDSSSSSSSVFTKCQTLPLQNNDKMRKEWGEDGVYRKLLTLWRHIRMVTPENLFKRGSHCGNKPMARARMFHSILCLKAKGVVYCIKDISGQTKYILKGSITRKLCTNLTD